jgi:enoyl-CoA hydratase/carnithine racemase
VFCSSFYQGNNSATKRGKYRGLIMAIAACPVPTSPVQKRHQDGIVFLSLNHPERRNALSRDMLLALKSALAGLREDKEARLVVLRAEGNVFSSGHDLRELKSASEKECISLFALCTEVMEALRNLTLPVIAQVQGLATAAGCQLVASCDLVVASEKATFATPGVKIGLFCTTPAVALCRAVTPKKALEMLLTGEAISAQEAERIGLVNRVVPADQLASATLALARQIITASRYTLAIGKRAFYAQLELDRSAAYQVAEPIMVSNTLAQDGQEGIQAFLEKRAPRWQP